ncbi:MAG: FHA domain-containing protein [Planctomycetota bacterium]|jgi:pSer/pThr/pTyr-binding forkhead associated (FHA) protein
MSCLLTVRGSRIELDGNRKYVLGRAEECDIVVDDLTASRRHARLTVGRTPEAVFVQDLDSHNGTFVNEGKVAGRTPLEHGNRLRIGATVFLVSLTDDPDEESEELLDTGTLTLEQSSWDMDDDEKLRQMVKSLGSLSTEFAGQINRFSFVQVLQVLVQTDRSGTLHVVVEEGPAEIEIRCGEVHAARHGDVADFPALLALARQKTGIFWLEETTARCPRTIEEPASRLLLQLCRALDETSPV